MHEFCFSGMSGASNESERAVYLPVAILHSTLRSNQACLLRMVFAALPDCMDYACLFSPSLDSLGCVALLF